MKTITHTTGNAMKDKTSNGVAYTCDIVSSQGAAFILFPEPEHTADDVKRAKAEIQAERDVVSIRVADEDDRDEDYRAQIFRDPRTKPLKWYEINDDRKLIRRERKAGTSVHDFVSRYVLPCIRQTVVRNNVEEARRFDVEEYIRLFGEPGSLPRLNVIACLDLGARSEAAKTGYRKEKGPYAN